MATINFRIEAPIAKYGTRLPVVENRLVWLIKDFIRDAEQIQGLSVGMSHVEFADGAYFTNVSIKNEWYESARGLKKLARKYDPNYDKRAHQAFPAMYATDLSSLGEEIVLHFQKSCDQLIVDRYAGIIKNEIGSLHTELGKDVLIRNINEDNSLFFVCREVDGKEKVGIVDKYGQTLIPLKYDDLKEIRNGYYLAKEAGKFGVVTLSNKVVVPLKYFRLHIFPLQFSWESLHNSIKKDYLLVAGKETGDGIRYGVVNLKGEVKIPFEFESLEVQYNWDQRFVRYGFMVAQKDGKYGMIDKEGSVIIPFEYDHLGQNGYSKEYFEFEDGYLGAVKDNKFGVVDVNNNVVIPFDRSKDALLDMVYPDVYFLCRPTNKTPEQRIADLAELENGLIKQDWECYKKDYLSGSYMREQLDKLRILYCNIDDRDAGKANELWDKYSRNGLSRIPDLFEDSNGNLWRTQNYMMEIVHLEKPSADNAVGVFLSPRERMQRIEKELRDIENQEIMGVHYGEFPPERVDSEISAKLLENDRRIEELHDSYREIRANYRKYRARGSEQQDRGGLSKTLQVVEGQIHVKRSKAEHVHNDNANILAK